MGGGKKDSKLMQNTDLFFLFIYSELWDKLFHAEEI